MSDMTMGNSCPHNPVLFLWRSRCDLDPYGSRDAPPMHPYPDERAAGSEERNVMQIMDPARNILPNTYIYNIYIYIYIYNVIISAYSDLLRKGHPFLSAFFPWRLRRFGQTPGPSLGTHEASFDMAPFIQGLHAVTRFWECGGCCRQPTKTKIALDKKL